jgi:hypothetical protein
MKDINWRENEFKKKTTHLLQERIWEFLICAQMKNVKNYITCDCYQIIKNLIAPDVVCAFSVFVTIQLPVFGGKDKSKVKMKRKKKSEKKKEKEKENEKKNEKILFHIVRK